VAERLDMISEEYERGWNGAPDGEGGFVFERDVRGVMERHILGRDMLKSAEARKVQKLMGALTAFFEKPAVFTRKEKAQTLFGPETLLQAVRAAGENGVKLQRYKGLGEMNPDQLWETTLDENARVLLQVKIKEADGADDIFSRLMGDVVEPRRAFIQDNALTAELDV
ncbi:MAG: DNA gyrase subunit B, partial [Planctomycetota bacterium]